MGLVQINKDLSERQLLLSGFLLALFLGLIGALLYWKIGLPQVAIAVWAVGGALVLLYFAVPAWRRRIYLGWLYAVFPVGWVVSHVVLGVVYYVFFTLAGLIMRLLRRDPLHRRFDPEAETYWTPKPEVSSADRYFHQY